MDEEGYVDNRGKKTFQNFKAYNIKDAIFNWAEAWKKVPIVTLRNAWCKLLKTPKTPSQPNDFEEFEAPSAANMLADAGQGSVTEQELEEWLDEDVGMPGYHHLTKEEIAQELTTPDTPMEDEDEEEEAGATQGGPSIFAGIEARHTAGPG